MSKRKAATALSFFLTCFGLAGPVSAQASLELFDSFGVSTTSFQEFQPIVIRATDPALAGWQSLTVRVESSLRGDMEWVQVTELPGAPGTFEGTVATFATLDPSPPAAGDQRLEVTELTAPLRYDALRFELQLCSQAVCPVANAAMTGNKLRLVDAEGADLETFSPPGRVHFEVWDFSVDPELPININVYSSLEGQIVSLEPAWQDPVQPRHGRFRGSILVEVADLFSADRLRVTSPTDYVNAFRSNPLGRGSSVDSVPVGAPWLSFLDRAGQRAEFLLLEDPVRIQAQAPSSNEDPFVVETLTATLTTRDNFNGIVGDTETVELVETGIDTGTFVAEIPAHVVYSPATAEDGELQAFYFSPNLEHVHLTVLSSSIEARQQEGALRFVDNAGNELEAIRAGARVFLQLESYYLALNPPYNGPSVRLDVDSPAEYEVVGLVQDAPGSAFFSGWITGSIYYFSFTPMNQNLEMSVPGIVSATLNGNLSFNTFAYATTFFGPNEPPVAGDDAFTVRGVTTRLAVFGNDYDPESNWISIVGFTQGTQGGVVAAVSGGYQLDYTPPPGFQGVDTFTYRVRDPEGGEDSATVTVTVDVDELPVAVADVVTVAEDTPLPIQALANDYDPDGDPIQFLSVDATTPHGFTLSGTPPANFVYRANANYNGTDTFSYRITGSAGTVTGTVTVTITPVPDAPTAQNDSVTTDEDSPLTFDPLVNDSDPDGDVLTVSAVGRPRFGTTTLDAGRITYTPNLNFYGLDSFTYTVMDTTGLQRTGTVYINVNSVNDPPDAVDDSVTTAEDTSKWIYVYLNDTDPDAGTVPLNLAIVSQPAHGTATASASHTVTYTPAANFHGTDSFTYRATDVLGASDIATVTVTVTPVNDAPLGVIDDVTASEDTPLDVDVLSNDTDIDGDALSVTSVGAATKGSVAIVTLSGRTWVRYSPNPNYSGVDSFSYSIRDPAGLSHLNIPVIVIVTPVNDPPVAVADSASTLEDTPVVINALANDSDIDLDTLSIVGYTLGGGAAGTISLNPNKTLTYSPALNYNGTGFITYEISDGAATASATISLQVTAVNDPPAAIPDTATTNEDTAVLIDVEANDSDPENQARTIWSWTSGARGTVTSSSGMLRYTPSANFNGTDSFTYTIRDSGSLSATTTVIVTVVPVNDAPTPVNNSGTLAEDTSVTLAVLANDTDPDGDPLTIAAVTQGTKGAVSFDSQAVTYTPATNANGSDSFTYTVSDGNGGTAVVTVSITITPVNDLPVAADDTGSLNEDGWLSVSFLANDSDIDGDYLRVTGVTQPLHGSVSYGSTYIDYFPAANYNGSDSFTYTVGDGKGGTASATVSLTVVGINDNPSPQSDSVTTPEDTPITFSVLTNDTDVDGDSLTITALLQGSRGVATFTATEITYTPTANSYGSDTVRYTVSDGRGGSAYGYVYITISPVNDPPIAVANSYTLAEDGVGNFSVLGNDSDPELQTLSITGVSQGANGTVTFTSSVVTYQPAANYNGPDSFTYTVRDTPGATATATVTVTVTAVNDPPTAIADAITVTEDTPFPLAVLLSNDSDIEGSTLSFSSFGQGAHGTVSFSSSLYTPAANYSGPDSFTYTVKDSNNATATATVTVTVLPVNDAPVAAADSATTPEETPITVQVLANDSDADGDSLSITGIAGTYQGTATFTAESISFTPATNINGVQSIQYTISDGQGSSATGVLSITVSAVNDPPVASDDSGTTTEDTLVYLYVLSNDTDPDAGSTRTITGATAGAHGSTTAYNTFIAYRPSANYNGPDSFTYTISDGAGGTASATVNITVTPVNDSPHAFDDTAMTLEDTSVVVEVIVNDVEVDGDTLTLSSVTQPYPGLGSVAVNGNSLTYTPPANYFGGVAFTYRVQDSTNMVASGTVSITVVPVNDPPVAVNDSATTNEAGSGVTLNVLANDRDLDSSPLSVSSVSSPAFGTATRNADNTITYVPTATYSGADSFTYTVSDGVATATATVSIQVKEVIGRVAVLGTQSVLIEAGADVLSGDVITNAAGSAPFLGTTELSLATGVTTASGWDVEGHRVTIAAGAVVASDVYSNTLTNSGTLTGATYSPLGLPVFSSLPALQTGTPNATDVNVGTSGTRTLAPGTYRDLIVGRKGVVTFTGGVYVFRSIQLNREVKLLFSAPSTIQVQQRMLSGVFTTIQPGAGSTATAATIVFHVAGINGTGGGITETPKSVEIGTDNIVSANIYAPNGTLWLRDRTAASGAFLGKHVRVGPDVQVTLNSAW